MPPSPKLNILNITDIRILHNLSILGTKSIAKVMYFAI